MQICLKSKCFQQLCPVFEGYQRLNSTVSFLQNEQHLVCIRGALYPDYVRRQRLNTAENAFQTPEFNRFRISLQFPLLTLPWKSKNSMNVNMLIRLRHLVTFRAQVRTNVSRDMCLQILCIIVLLCLSQPKSQLIQCMHVCLCCLCINILLPC